MNIRRLNARAAALWAALSIVPGAFGEADYNLGEVVAMEDLDLQWACGGAVVVDAYFPKDDKTGGIKIPPAPYGQVLCLHGGGWMHGSKESCRPMAKSAASTGYFVGIAVQYPLHNDAASAQANGTPPWTVHPAVTMDAEVDSVNCVVSVLQAVAREKFPKLLSPRIVAFGHSAGGHLAMEQALNPGRPTGTPWRKPGYVVGAVSWAGPSDLTLPMAQPFDSILRPWVPDGDRARRSPRLNVKPSQAAPMLLWNATDDALVEPAHARAMCSAMPGGSCQAVYVTGGHGLDGWTGVDARGMAKGDAWWWSLYWAAVAIYYNDSVPTRL